RLAVLTASFVADCLETLEEIGIRLRAQWMELGGEELLLVPCVNETPVWVEAVTAMVSQQDRS
ncbi:MAG: ferrochelatase, partial [Acidimicrobiia bacterium]